MAASPAATPQVPPTEVAAALVRYGNVRAVPLRDVRVTTGTVLSIVIDCGPLVPTLLALSDWVAVTVYTPSVAKAVVGVNVHALLVQVAVPFCVLAPGDRDGHGRARRRPRWCTRRRPSVTVAEVVYGKVRTAPLTDVSVTSGAAVWTVIALAPLVPVLAPVSVCVAVTL